MSELSPLGTLFTFLASGAGVAALIKVLEYIFSSRAKSAADRRSSMEEDIERKNKDIEWHRAALVTERQESEQREREREKRFQEERTDFERRVRDEVDRRDRAERDKAQMEGLLYRMGWERTDRGWKRNGGEEVKP